MKKIAELVRRNKKYVAMFVACIALMGFITGEVSVLKGSATIQQNTTISDDQVPMGVSISTISRSFRSLFGSHTHTYVATVTKAATCTATGIKTYKCSSCGATYTEIIAATGHTYVATVTKAATCTLAGVKTYKCSKCGLSYTTSIPATGHTLNAWTVKTPATYTTTGLQVQTCKTCGVVVNTAAIAVVAHTHNYSSTVTTAAKCTTAGVKTYKCSICGNTYTEAIPATGHTLGAWVITSQPTVIAVGTQTQSCTVCGKVINTQSIPKLTHNHDYAVVSAVTATNKTQGSTTYTCSICGDTYTETTGYNDNFVNVKENGAIGDGVSDDTAALNKIFKDQAGKTIYFPAGTYIISGAVYLYSNTTITGEGTSSVIMACAGMPVGTTMLYTNGTTGLKVTNISVSGNSSINTRDLGYSDKDGIHLLDLWNSSNVTVSNCHFINNIYAAIRSIGTSNILVDSNEFSQTDCGFVTLGNVNASNITITNNSFNGHDWSEPVAFYANANFDNVIIMNNKILNKINATGIFVSSKGINTNFKIENNYLENVAVGICVYNINSGTICNNIINGTTSGRGISVNASSNMTVTGNTINSSNQDALYVTDCTNTNVSGNTISGYGWRNANYFGIRVSGANNQINITNNSVTKTDTSLSTMGIYVNGTGNIQFSGNILNNCQVWLGAASSGVSMDAVATAIRNDSSLNTLAVN